MWLLVCPSNHNSNNCVSTLVITSAEPNTCWILHQGWIFLLLIHSIIEGSPYCSNLSRLLCSCVLPSCVCYFSNCNVLYRCDPGWFYNRERHEADTGDVGKVLELFSFVSQKSLCKSLMSPGDKFTVRLSGIMEKQIHASQCNWIRLQCWLTWLLHQAKAGTKLCCLKTGRCCISVTETTPWTAV